MVDDGKIQRPGYFAYDGLDRVLHEKARLGILTALVTRSEGLRFTELKQLCSLTDGNLARHLQVLQDGGLTRRTKDTGPGRKHTSVTLTSNGRKIFLGYLDELQRVIEDARPAGDADWAPA